MLKDKFFTIQKPLNHFLSTIVDYYFHVDASVNELAFQQELVIPFPRLNFLYFFNHPFLITNHTQKRSVSANMVISRMTTDNITIQPQSDRVKIVGAHVYPHCLAYLTIEPVTQLSWLIDTESLFKTTAINFKEKIDKCSTIQQMFDIVEKTFLDNVLVRDLSLISKAIEQVEKSKGDIQIKALSEKISVSERTIRNHFYEYVGCSPKEYIRLVKLRQVAYQMKYSKNSLTDIAYDNNYADQAHFIHDVKNFTGMSPKQLKKEIPGFRFLQF
jgi:AraC-like DNA-binding protein